MPANRKKLLELISAQIEKSEERCKGYRKALHDHVAEILYLEYENSLKGTNIRQKVEDQCSALGKFLARMRPDKA